MKLDQDQWLIETVMLFIMTAVAVVCVTAVCHYTIVGIFGEN